MSTKTERKTYSVDLAGTFQMVRDQHIPTESEVTAAESVATKASVVAAFRMYLRIVGVADGKPGRYATMSGRALSVVQKAYKIGTDIARIGEKVTAAQAAASSWLRNDAGLQSAARFDALLTRANDGAEVTPGIVGPEYGRLLVTAQAIAQAEKVTPVPTEQGGEQTDGEQTDGEQPTEPAERTDEQRIADALKGIRPVLKRAADGTATEDALVALVGLHKAVTFALKRAESHARKAAAATETETEEVAETA